VPDRKYTPTFGGTSSATPQVAAAAACLQGLAKQFWGIPLSPEQIRVALGAPAPVPLDPPRLFGGFGQFCTLDLDPDEGPNLIGLYPNVAGTFGSAASVILNQSGISFFGENPLVDDIQVLVGTLVHGNVFSIKASDNNHLVISSRTTTPSGPEVAKRGDIISGNITDVLIRSHVNFSNVDDITVTAETFVTGGAGVLLLYMYSWDFGRWLVAGVDVLDGDDSIFPVGNANQFIRDSDKRVLFRLQTVSSAFGPDYEAFHDWVELDAGGDPHVPSDGP
jgi:hypothetical protein